MQELNYSNTPICENIDAKGFKIVSKALKKNIRNACFLDKTNSAIFKVGKFLSKIKFRDEDSTFKMYYDFKSASLINKTFLLFVKEQLLNCHDKDSALLLFEMLNRYNETNLDIMSMYIEELSTFMVENKYSSLNVRQNLSKVLKNNEFLQKQLVFPK